MMRGLSDLEFTETSDLIDTFEDNEIEEVVVEEVKPEKKRRGRPPKIKEAVVEEPAKVEVKPVKTQTMSVKAKMVEELPEEIVEYIFNSYSTTPLEVIMKKTELSRSIILKTLEQLEHLFEDAFTTGILTRKQYDEHIKIKFQEYSSMPAGIRSVVKKSINKIVKD